MSQTDTKLNGQQPRRPLSEQLDRLDGILDALDAGLAVVVADAVKKAAAEAAHQTADAIAREMLTSPEVARAAQADKTFSAPSWLPPLAAGAHQGCLFAWKHRITVSVSLSAGLIVFVASYLCGPTASSLVLAALGAAVGAASVSGRSRLWAWLTGRACRPRVDDRTADEALIEAAHPEIRVAADHPEEQGKKPEREEEVLMADEVLLEEFHLKVRIPGDLPEREVEAARRVLDSRRFQRRLERAVRNWFRRHCALRKAVVTLSV